MNHVWTIGHSTRSIAGFIELLKAHRIETVADVRRFPGSRRHPQFNSENFAASLRGAGIGYAPFPELGGRRKARSDSHNTAWRNEAFRGYADFMETDEFQQEWKRLVDQASSSRTAVLCAELLWWQCHRSLIADRFKAEGWTVLHIRDAGPAQEHPWTPAATLVNGRLSYDKEAASRQKTLLL